MAQKNIKIKKKKETGEMYTESSENPGLPDPSTEERC